MNKEKFMLLGCGLLTAATMQAQGEKKPNIIYIMCDDMGYSNLGCYRQNT